MGECGGVAAQGRENCGEKGGDHSIYACTYLDENPFDNVDPADKYPKWE